MNEKNVQTVLGIVSSENLGFTLPHEHLFTDLRGPQVSDYAQARPEEVVAVMLPYLEAAYAAGVRSFVECSTVGVGRNVTVLESLAQATPIHLLAPTGVYRQGYIPEALIPLTVEELADSWVRDLTVGIDGTAVKAGFIKIAASDDGPTPLEERNLKAAAIAGRETGAVVASHTIGGSVAWREMEVLEAAGLDLARFIWVHANAEPDHALHLEAAKRGVIVEFDGIGAPWQDQETMLEATLAFIEAGFVEQLLLSHDAGWYQPGAPAGQPDGGMRGYTALFEDFLPRLRERGVGEDIVEQITVSNPARIFPFAQT
jgi:phosphotriesterase-related protein